MSCPSNRKAVAILFCISLMLCMMNIFPNKASMNENVKAEQMGILNYEAYALLREPAEEPMDPAQISQAGIDMTKGIQQKADPVQFGLPKARI